MQLSHVVALLQLQTWRVGRSSQHLDLALMQIGGTVSLLSNLELHQEELWFTTAWTPLEAASDTQDQLLQLYHSARLRTDISH